MEAAAEPTLTTLAAPASGSAASLRSAALSRRKILVVMTLSALLGLGAFLRIYPSSGYERIGFDEHGYAVFVKEIQVVGFWNYDAVVKVYLERQRSRAEAIVPATRIGFLAPATLAANVFHLDPLRALKVTSCLASLLLLAATAVIGFRYGGATRMLLMTALMATAPLQVAFAQRAMIDGYFAFWAVLTAWFFWECLQAPQRRGWLAAYALSLFVLILTKESAAFVFTALMATATVILFRHRRWPAAPLLWISVATPLLAVLFLASQVGGIGEWISFYRMFIAKSAALHYAIQWQDGAWYRYLIDFVLLSPCIVALAFGRIFQIDRTARVDVFWALLLGFSFVFMSSVPYGMSLRFAAYWDEPLRWLAASQLIPLMHRLFPRRAWLGLALAVILVMAVDLSQYSRFFVRGRIYDPISVHLLRASDLVK
jgi:hypothetical protein